MMIVFDEEGCVSRTRVKVCCISSFAEAEVAIAAGADALGLVGAMPSGPGVIDDGLSGRIAASAPPGVATFLLTSETTAAGILEHVDRVKPGVVQVVRHIDPAECTELAGRLSPERLVQVIHVEDAAALDAIDRYSAHVDAFLLDSGRPGAAIAELGGTGRVHDWAISAAFVRRSPKPVFLAGGLDPENVGEAIATVRPYAVDVCSGVRTDGRLDAGKLERLMRAVASADRSMGGQPPKALA